MKIFLGILAVVLIILVFAEKDDNKRKHLSWISMTALIATAIVDIVSAIF